MPLLQAASDNEPLPILFSQESIFYPLLIALFLIPDPIS